MNTDEIIYSERGLEALILRLEGRTYTEIGQKMEVSRQRACQLVDQACHRILRHPEHSTEIPPHLMQAFAEVARGNIKQRRLRRNVTVRRIRKALERRPLKKRKLIPA